MSITRRALLGALVGLPFAAKAALGSRVPKRLPEVGDITITGKPGFNQQRIEDIGDAFLLSLESQMGSRGIRFTKTIDDDWPAMRSIPFLILSEDSNKSILSLQRLWSTPVTDGLVQYLIEHHDSKCRYYGVWIRHHEEGLVVTMTFSHDEAMPEPGDTLYSEWLRAL